MRGLFGVCCLAPFLVLATGCEADNGADVTDSTEKRPDTAESQVAREVEPQVDGQRFAELFADQRDFAFSLLRQLGEGDDDNLFVSPYSIASALAMVYAGAQGATRANGRDPAFPAGR